MPSSPFLFARNDAVRGNHHSMAIEHPTDAASLIAELGRKYI